MSSHMFVRASESYFPSLAFTAAKCVGDLEILYNLNFFSEASKDKCPRIIWKSSFIMCLLYIMCCIFLYNSRLKTTFKACIVTHTCGTLSSVPKWAVGILSRSTAHLLQDFVLVTHHPWACPDCGSSMINQEWENQGRCLGLGHRICWLRKHTEARSQEGTVVHFRQTDKSKRATRSSQSFQDRGQSQAVTQEPKMTWKSEFFFTEMRKHNKPLKDNLTDNLTPPVGCWLMDIITETSFSLILLRSFWISVLVTYVVLHSRFELLVLCVKYSSCLSYIWLNHKVFEARVK